MNNMDLAVVYCRKSSEDKNKQIASIGDQIDEANKLIKDYELSEVCSPFKEEKTGKESGVRTEFYKMIELIESGKANTIITWKADRLARNGGDGGKVIEMVDKGIIKRIITPGNIFDRNNSYMLWIEFMGSTKFSKDLSDTVKRRLKIKAEKGIRPGRVPIGYRNTPSLLKGDRQIIVDPDRFPLVRKWWELMLTGQHTVKSSHEIMKARGLRDRRGNVIKFATAVRIFRNIFYAGIFDYGGVRYQGSYKKMITLSEFLKVQKIMDLKGKHGRTNKRLPFQGMMLCGECGSTITGEKHKRGRHTFWYYRCKKNHGPCGQVYLNADLMNPQIKDYLKTMSIEPEFTEWLKGVLKRRNRTEFELAKKEKELLTKRVQELDSKKEVIAKLKIDGVYDEAKYRKKINDILTEEKQLHEAMLNDRGNFWLDVVNQAVNFSSTMLKLFDKGDIFTRQMILRILGSNIYIKDKKLDIKAKSVFMGIKIAENAYLKGNGLVEHKKEAYIPPNQEFLAEKIYSVPRV